METSKKFVVGVEYVLCGLCDTQAKEVGLVSTGQAAAFAEGTCALCEREMEEAGGGGYYVRRADRTTRGWIRKLATEHLSFDKTLARAEKKKGVKVSQLAMFVWDWAEDSRLSRTSTISEVVREGTWKIRDPLPEKLEDGKPVLGVIRQLFVREEKKNWQGTLIVEEAIRIEDYKAFVAGRFRPSTIVEMTKG